MLIASYLANVETTDTHKNPTTFEDPLKSYFKSYFKFVTPAVPLYL